MNRFDIGRPLLVFAISFGAACAPDDPSVTAPVESALARGKLAVAAYTSRDLGALLGANSSQANGVNDAGAAVGRAGNHAAMWSDGGVRTTVEPPPGRGFVNGEGRDINNAGHAVFVFFQGPVDVAPARGFLRLASGNLVELVPLAGDATTYANGLSEVQNNTIYIAGSSRTSESVSRAVRWTMDVTSGAILSTEVRPENSHALAVSNDGATVGFVESDATNSLRSTAFLWRGNNLLALNPPKGARDGRAWAVSASGAYVAGDAARSLSRTAIRWTILAP